MSTLYCPRCSKTLTYSGVFSKTVTTPSSGPFIIGHPFGNPNLLAGIPLNSSTSRQGLFCKVCGEEIREIPSKEETREALEKFRQEDLIFKLVGWTILIIFFGTVGFCLIKSIINNQ